MEDAELSRNYISIEHDGSLSYGGSQEWFEGQFRRCGCAVIAAADIAWYLQGNAGSSSDRSENAGSPDIRRNEGGCGQGDMPAEQYKQYIRKTGRSFPRIPYRGIPGFLFALQLEFYFLRRSWPFRAAWGPGAISIRRRAAEMIRENIPVPVCIGPCLHQIHKPPLYHGLKLYREKNGQYVWDRTVRNHVLVITAIHGKWAKVSSWGEAFYIDLKELGRLSFGDALGAFTNIIRIRREEK